MASNDALLAHARQMLSGPPVGDRVDGLAGVWPRSVALLGRQALERALDDFWLKYAPGVERASRHAQLLCLGAYLDNPNLVSDVRHAWMGLTRGCHHHAYELPPTAGELQALLDAVDRFLSHLN